MRKLLLGVVLGMALARVILDQPWRYTWAFGQDLGAARSADWKNKACSKALAATLYDDAADSAVTANKGNRFLFLGEPGHSYYVYGFRTQTGCEQARTALGSAQWDQSTR